MESMKVMLRENLVEIKGVLEVMKEKSLIVTLSNVRENTYQVN